MEPTPRNFHQFGNSDAMFIRLLQSFHVSQFNLTQWATVLTYLNLGFIYGDIPHPSGGCYSSSWLQKVARINSQLLCFYGQVCTSPEYSFLEDVGTICPV